MINPDFEFLLKLNGKDRDGLEVMNDSFIYNEVKRIFYDLNYDFRNISLSFNMDTQTIPSEEREAESFKTKWKTIIKEYNVCYTNFCQSGNHENIFSNFTNHPYILYMHQLLEQYGWCDQVVKLLPANLQRDTASKRSNESPVSSPDERLSKRLKKDEMIVEHLANFHKQVFMRMDRGLDLMEKLVNSLTSNTTSNDAL